MTEKEQWSPNTLQTWIPWSQHVPSLQFPTTLIFSRFHNYHHCMILKINQSGQHCQPHNCIKYLERFLEGGGLVLCVLGNGRVRSTTLTMPHFVAKLINVLIRSLLALCSHLHHMVRICLDKSFCWKQSKIYGNRPTSDSPGKLSGSTIPFRIEET